MAGPLIGSENASISMLMVNGKEALAVSVALFIAIQLTVAVLVVP